MQLLYTQKHGCFKVYIILLCCYLLTSQSENSRADFVDFSLQTRMGQVEATWRDEKSQSASSSDDFSLLKAKAKLKITKRLYAKVSTEYDDESLVIKDAYLNYGFRKLYSLSAGRFREPFSLDYKNSSSDTPFSQRSAPT